MDSWIVHFLKWTISLSISQNGQFHIWVITYTQNRTTVLKAVLVLFSPMASQWMAEWMGRQENLVHSVSQKA